MFALYIVLYVQWCASLRMHEDARRIVRGVLLQREQPTHYRDVECIYTTHIIFQNIQWFSSIQWWRAAQAHMIAIVKVHTRHVTCSSSRKPHMYKYMQLHPQWPSTVTYNIILYIYIKILAGVYTIKNICNQFNVMLTTDLHHIRKRT